jgi:hypothetical protein
MVRSRPDGALISSWSELQKATFPNQTSCPTDFPRESYPNSPLGYVSNGMAALAIMSDHEYPGARQSYDWLNERQSGVPFSRDPTWRIVPR